MNDGYDEYCRGLIAQAQSDYFDHNDRSAACGCADYLAPTPVFRADTQTTEDAQATA